MSISVSQINGSQLYTFVVNAASGGAFSGNLGAYIAGSGYFGPNLIYTTGGFQNVATTLTFQNSPNVPYSGASGTAPSQQWVQDTVLYYVNSLSGAVTGGYVLINGNQTINDYKVFTGALGVGTASLGIHAATLAQLSGASGILAAAGAGAISGVLNTTIANTGQAAWTSSNGAANTLSGLLTASGQALSAVKVTGSSVNNVVNFTGLGGTLVFTSGGFTFISGAAGGGGGTVTQGQLDALSGTLGASGSQLYVLLMNASGQFNSNFATILNLALTGSNLYATMTGLSGQAVTDYATKTQLTNSGVTIETQINSLSGFVLTQSAASGSQVRVTGSPNIAIADLSGVGGTLVYTLGGQILISGAGSSVGGGTTTLARWTALDNAPPATAYATFDTANNVPVLNFDAVTGESGIFSNIMPQGASFSNGIDARIFFRAAGGVTGGVVWNAAFESGNSNLSSDAWTTGINSSGALANGTLGKLTVATITFNSGEIGGITAGDFFRLRLSRVALDAADTMTGDAQFAALEIRQR